MASILTVQVAGSTVVITGGDVTNRIDMRSQATITVLDTPGTAVYSYGQSVTITDSVQGLLFSGFVDTVDTVHLYPQTMKKHTLACKDNHYLADKRYFTRTDYTNRLAGDIVNDLLANELGVEGVVANYAYRRDNTTSTFGAGTLSGTVAVNNDLELTSAGSTVTQTETNFGGGTLTLTETTGGGSLRLASNQGISFVGTCQANFGNAFVYYKIYSGAYTIVAGDFLSYYIWVNSGSPQIMAGVDIVFTDGTSVRDFNSNGIVDQNNLMAHPKQDLNGFANDQWYKRNISLTQVIGKTVSFVTIAFEGDNGGTYAAYFRNILIGNGGGTQITFYNGSFQNSGFVGDNGYSNVSVQSVRVYEKIGYRISPSWSVNGVGKAKSSLTSWTATIPTNTALEVDTSLDGGATWQTCTNHAAIPNLLVGTNLTSRNLQTRQILSITGKDPVVTPLVTNVAVTVQPSYAATKTDVIDTRKTQGDFNGGTLNNILVASNGDTTVAGAWRNWDDASLANQTVYGNGTPLQQINAKRCELRTNATSEIRSDLVFAGQSADFTMECDIQLADASGNYGLTYRNTAWSNNVGSYAYCVYFNTAQIALNKGTNGGGVGGTQLAVTALTLTAGQWYHLMIVASGTNHKAYLDGVLYINATDATYGAAGDYGLLYNNPSASRLSGFFNNFGVVFGLTGIWTSTQTALTGISTVGKSVIMWNADLPPNCTLLVESTHDNGTHWDTCTNGGQIPVIGVPGYSITTEKLQFRFTITIASASAMTCFASNGVEYMTATVHGITAWMQGQYSASGTRISPVLSLNGVGRAGNTSVSWVANIPTNTTLTVKTSPDNVTYTTIAASGNAIAGINGQPDPTIDGYDADSSANYTSTNYAGGANATWTMDTSNSRLSGAGGTTALYVWNQITAKDVIFEAVLNQAENAGLVARYVDTNNFYFVVIRDASAGASPNTITLSKRVAGSNTQLGTWSISPSFIRGNYHDIKFSLIGTALKIYWDGTQQISVTDSDLSSSASIGFTNNGGTAYWYSLRAQPQGDDLTGKNVYSKLTLTSTDPTVTPQVTDITVSAHDQNIMNGVTIQNTSWQYSNTISACMDDLAKKSNYWWAIDQNKKPFFQSRPALPAPWPLATVNQGLNGVNADPDILIATPPKLKKQSPLYRNRQTVVGGMDVTTLQTETRYGDGTTQAWAMSYPLSDMPHISVTGPVASQDSQSATIGIRGVDTGKQYYWQPGNNVISQDASLTPLAGPNGTIPAETITFSYYGQIQAIKTSNSVSQQTALAALDGTSGIIDAVEKVSNLNATAAQQLADARIAQYAVLTREWGFSTLRAGLQPGQSLETIVPEYGLNDVSLLITEVKINWYIQANGTLTIFDVLTTEGPNLKSWAAFFDPS